MTSDDRATSTTDDHFGSCPECGQASVYVNIGREHWFYCDEHRVKWCVGANLFSSWRYQGPAQWEENHRKLQGYREMLPASTDRRGGLPLRNAQADRKPPALFRDTTMNLFRWIRSLTGPPRPGEPVDRESSSVMPLRLVSRHRFGGLVIGHYLTNPGECPDHVFRHDCRFQTFTQGDFETTRWTVTPLAREEDVALERVPFRAQSDYMVVLTDEAGNVILQDYCTAEGANRAMAIIERAQQQGGHVTDGPDPFSYLSEETAPTYPLTTDELRYLAVHWATMQVKNDAWCVVFDTGGSLERAIARYTTGRLKHMAAILGDHEMAAVFREADERVRRTIGDEFWALYQERGALGMERLEADRRRESNSGKEKTPPE